MKWAKQNKGFTIVELLIVIVVIAILAAITIVAYNGIQNRAKTSAVQTSVSQASKKIQVSAVQNSDQYPANLAAAGVSDTDSVRYLYSSDNDASPRLYCVTAINGDFSSYISSTGGTVKSGICPGHWDKTLGSTANAPISGMTYDTSLFRTSTGSMRIGPGGSGTVRNGPFTGTTGQTVTVGMWIRTSAVWDGTASNSKIRFGNGSGGALLASCSYDGAKTSWVFYSCSYTFTSGVASVNIGVANDGTTGNVLFDDFSISYPGM